MRKELGKAYSFSHDFVAPPHLLLGEACKGASHRLQISLKEGG